MTIRVYTEQQVDRERRRSYGAGCAKVRDQWAKWFETLPAEVQDAIKEADAARRQREMFQRALEAQRKRDQEQDVA